MYYQNETDETLVMLTLAGEQSAYEVLVVRYQRAVILTAQSVTKSEFMAEDAAQDAFVTAWMKLNTLQDARKFGSWVCRIAKNCALNMISRYRSFLPLDVVENINTADTCSLNPAEEYEISEQRDEVKNSVAKLPKKIRQIINLHYFDGLSIAEIADRMRVSEGTVKWQLHDGRKRIRKELCAMNEKYSDTLVQRVMKKVEELKLWRLKNDKHGFEKVYMDVLRDVEELPESADKNHALADVLMHGWWWLPSKKNDALFARIADAAMAGKNEEVMIFIVAREDSQVAKDSRIEFVRDKQIPRLEKAGFVKALAYEWFWLGLRCYKVGRMDEANAAYDKAREISKDDNIYHSLSSLAKMLSEKQKTREDKEKKHYFASVFASEYRLIDGELRFWEENGISDGRLQTVEYFTDEIFRNSSLCDGRFFADIKCGESFVGSDGSLLTFAADNETVCTPAGKFDGCRLWITKPAPTMCDGKIVCKSYYKDGVGIVKHIRTCDGFTDTRLLANYTVISGKGLLPFCEGNTWEYTSEYNPETVNTYLKFTVAFADDSKVILNRYIDITRLKFDKGSWLDAMKEIRSEYCTSDYPQHLCDVYPAIERAETLAVTRMEKAHTNAACSVMRRILSTDPAFNTACSTTGHWNFFSRKIVYRQNDEIKLGYGYYYRWSFEWKNTDMSVAEYPILCNDIYGILMDAANCIWSDEWRIGASPIVEYTKWSHDIKTQITCEDGGTITTKAGTFENCLKLSLDIGGMTDGHSYRGGKKVYYFANGVGIVRTENEYAGGARTAVYELTSYAGTGEGYMPIADGLVRRYDALDLTDGFVGAAEYTYVADDEGDIVIFADRTGIRELPPPITQYSAIQGEVIEEKLWNAGKWKETHIRYGLNNANLLLHFLARPSWNRNDAERSTAITEFNQKLILLLGDDESVPDAWCGLYAWNSLILSAALFGKGNKDEGYRCLEDAVTYFEKWYAFNDGEELSLGNRYVFGGAAYIKGKQQFICADGTREPINYSYRMEPFSYLMYRCLTAPSGWEWFNSVRNEDKFKQYIERAKKLPEIH